MKIFDTVVEGALFPRGHGLVRHDYAARSAHTALMPLNVVLGFGWAAFLWIRWGWYLKGLTTSTEAYRAGIRRGREIRRGE